MEVLQFAPTVVEINHRNLEAGRDITLVQVWADKVSVTCLLRLEPPLFPELFALTRGLEERCYSDGNSLYSNTLTNPHRPRLVGFFMATRYANAPCPLHHRFTDELLTEFFIFCTGKIRPLQSTGDKPCVSSISLRTRKFIKSIAP
jgi:hypothetical protein